MDIKDLVNQLVEDIVKLSRPLSIQSIANIMMPHQLVFHPLAIAPKECHADFIILSSIINKLFTYKTQTDNQIIVSQLRQSIEEINSSRKLAHDEIVRLEKELAANKVIIDELYQTLYDEYCEKMSAEDNPMAPLLQPSDTQSQLELIQHFYEVLLKKQSHLLLYEKLLHYHEIVTLRTETIQTLSQFDILVTSTKPIELFAIIEPLYEDYDVLQKLKANFEQYLELLSTQVLKQDLNKLIHELENQIKLSEETMQIIAKEIKTFSHLGLDIHHLDKEYIAARDKAAYISEKEQFLRAATSSLSIGNWIKWGFDNQYAVSISEKTVEIKYLQLVNKQETESQILTSLLYMLSHAQSIVPKYHDVLLDEQQQRQQIENAISLLENYLDDYSLPHDNPIAYLVTDIAMSITQLQARLDILNQKIVLLEKLRELDKSILSLSTEKQIIEASSFLQDNQILISLKQGSYKRQDKLERVNDIISRAKRCIESLQSTKVLNSNLEGFAQHIQMLNTEYQQQQTKLFQYKEVSELPAKIETLELEIIADVTQLVSTQAHKNELATEEFIEVDEKEVYEQSQSIDRAQTESYLENIKYWDRKIYELIKKSGFPDQLFIWYQELYLALKSHMTDDISYFQITQLLRDIHFELEYPNQSNAYTVLYQYQIMCPTPAKDWELLTRIKPPFPVDYEAKINFENNKLQAKFNALYQQQKNLAIKHPRESLLLLQTTNNLHQLAFVSQYNTKVKTLFSLNDSMADPRYQSLHQHRGFLIVCELLAKLCTNILQLINLTRDGDYHQRFFYQKTRSTELLESASSELTSFSADTPGFITCTSSLNALK